MLQWVAQNYRTSSSWGVLWGLTVVTTQNWQLRSGNLRKAAPVVIAHKTSPAGGLLSMEQGAGSQILCFPLLFRPSFSSLWNGFSDRAVFQSGRARDSCKLRHREECPVLLLAGTGPFHSSVSRITLHISAIVFVYRQKLHFTQHYKCFWKVSRKKEK